MKSTLYTIILFYISIYTVNSQTPLDKAQWKFEDKNYMDAVLEFEKVIPKISSEKNKIDAYTKLGHSYFFLNDYSKAQSSYEEALNLNASDPQLFVNYGDILTYNGKFEKAQEMYSKAINDTAWGKIALAKKSSAKNATKTEDSFSILLHKNEKDLNSDMGDYGFYLLNNNLAVFTSSSMLFNKTKDKKTGQGFSRLVLAEKDQEKNWKVKSILPEYINSQFNNGSFCYDSIYKIGYFSQCNGPDGKGKACVLLSTTYDIKTNKWGNPEVLPFCNDGFNYAHPSISKDGKTLYFTSDRAGGLGGKDIYKSSKGSGHNGWGMPTNLGSEINTEGNEAFPSICGDSIFYFSSNTRTGLGGYDIFKAEYNLGAPKNAKNLAAPFNSPADDFGLIHTHNSKYDGYYSSNRAGGVGGDDIYSFSLDPKYKTLAGKLTEQNSNIPLANATLTIQGTDGSVHTVKTNNNGEFKLDNINPEAGYKIIGSADDYFSASTLVKGINLNANADHSASLKERNNIQIQLTKITKDEIKLDNIYYAYNKADLTEATKKELQKLITLLTETPEINIVINSHSDEQGSDKYNLDLSERRAKSVVDYLIENGIASSRLTSKGWGETKPLHKDANSEEQHAANRRTTFQVTNAN